MPLSSPEEKRLDDVDALKEWTEAARRHRIFEGDDLPIPVARWISRGI